MSKEETEIEIEDTIRPQLSQPRPADPVALLPVELRDAARRLKPEKAFTLLTLKEEGTGHNASLLSVAATCFKMGVSFDDTLDHLSAAYSPDRMDYETAPKRAVQRVWEADGDLSKLVDDDAEHAPDAREEMLLRFRRTPSTEMVEASPGKLATLAIEIIQRLFDAEDIINIQNTALEFGTLVKVKEIPGFLTKHGCPLEDYKFLNPATFKKIDGVPNSKHPEKKISTRCNDNVKKRDWMLLEFDPAKDDKTPEISTERFNTFALALAQFAPLILAVDTGNKSVHFWFDAKDVKPGIRRGFFNLACLHGADPRLAVKSQIARMPNTPSAGPGRGAQRVLYYDPENEATPEAWDLPGFEKYLQENKQLEYYYNSSNKTFLTRDNMDTWIDLDRRSISSHLAEKGFRSVAMEGEFLTPLDSAINRIQMDKSIEAVLANASGRHAGLYEENGHRVIVKKSPSFIKPRKGDWSTIRSFLQGLLAHEKDQLEVFLGWLSSSVRDLRNDGKRRAVWSPCQFMHLAGPPNAGKTLLLKDILTPCFANRVGNADPIFKKFPDLHNPDTFGCELLFLDDSPVLESNYAFRQEFGERIKTHVVGIGGGLRGMHQGRINMRPWWRFIRLMNIEPATLSTLPPLDEGIEDKLILLLGADMQKGPLGKEMLIAGWYERIERRITAEVPAFLHFLLETFELPEHLKDTRQRFPTVSFKSDELVSMIAEGSPEQYLLHRIDTDGKTIFLPKNSDVFGEEFLAPEAFTGTADQLYDELAGAGMRAGQIRFTKTCPNPRVLVSQLRSLEKSHPDRVQYSKRADGWADKLRGAEYWIILPPCVEPVQTVESDLEDLF